MVKKHLLSNLLILVFLFSGLSFAEKKPLNHSVYDNWKSIGQRLISFDGNWIAYEVNPQRGDGWLFLYNLQTGQLDSVPRGSGPVFSPGSEYLAFRVKPEFEKVRQAKLDNKSSDEMPKDSLGIWNLKEDSKILIERIKTFAVAQEETPWLVYLQEPHPTGNNENENENNNKQDLMVIFNPMSGESFEFQVVTEFHLSKNGKLAAFIQQEENNSDTIRVRTFDTERRSLTTVFEADGDAKNITTGEQGSQAAFLFSEDDENPKIYSLFYWKKGNDGAELIAAPQTEGMPEGWSASEHSRPSFSENGDRLFFGTAPKPQPEPEDTLLEEEKYKVDIWHYRDPKIQPQQLVEADREKRRTYTAVFNINRGNITQLADKDMPDITTRQYGNGLLEMGYSNLPYLIQNSFESGEYRDVFLVNVETGEREMVLEKHRGSVHLSTLGDARLSPGGKYLLYFLQDDLNWYTLPVDTKEPVNITASIPYAMHNKLHDAPSDPGPYGVGGWKEDDSYVLVYDHYDVWKVDPLGKKDPVNLTNGYGRKNNIRFRVTDLDPDRDFFGPREHIMLSAFNLKTKQNGFYTARAHRSEFPRRLVMEDARFFRPLKAKEEDVLVWQKSTFTMFPDLWVSDVNFRNQKKISHANPQQQDYLWGEVKLVEWVSFNNDTLQGLLYTPENFDPEKKYPMIVYFYERVSDGKHIHFAPSPSRSTINRSYCVSNGYVVFAPDIPYTIGYPGQSAYNSIVSGTKAIVNQFDFIDRENIGLQGQSWAGYQIAYLITQTNMFKAAMAGAPVSNMVSAYGGIRWSTGLSRIYQYEETQSRIGGTLWEKPFRYIENSPVFFADKVNTPLLMMHNDDDGAVPWYQGIEYYMALRRLGKPVWMLNYNDEAHNLTRRPNMMDLSIRMYQFFDHYLKGKPAPRWMKEGIPAVKKGKIDGYELVE